MIKEFHGYNVSDNGDVYGKNGQPLKRRLNKGAYSVRLYISGTRYDVKVKNLVAELFVDNPDGFECVIQMDKDIDNCNAHNLKWVARSDVFKRTSKPCLKFKDGKLVKRYESETDAGKSNGVKAIVIHHWCTGKYKDKRGFVWEYD